MLSKSLTGHMYAGSAHETCDDCGNCDGARCDNCREVYLVEGVDKRFTSIDEARAAEEEIQSLSIYNGKSYDSSGFTIIDNILHTQIHATIEGSWCGQTMIVPCNLGSSLYEEKYKETRENMDKFQKCKCSDKEQESCGNSCDVFKSCNDHRCYYEMLAGRKERKWYL